MSQVVIRYPETGGIAVATQDQFEMLYSPRGWEILAVDTAFASTIVGVPIADLAELDVTQLHTVTDAWEAQKPSEKKAQLTALSADELRDLAKQAGVPAGGSKDDIADRIITAEKVTD